MASTIETKIDRIAAAKEAIAAAIAGKGVTVPDGTLIDGMAALIASIEAGGGGGSGFVTGSFVYDSDTWDRATIKHNLGKVPTFALIYAESATATSGKRFIRGGGFICADPSQSIPDGMFWVNAMNTSSATTFAISGNSDNGGYGLLQSVNSGGGCQFNGITENELQWCGFYFSNRTYILPGVEYKYIIGVFNEVL